MTLDPFASLSGLGILSGQVVRVCDGDTIRVRWTPGMPIHHRWRLADVDASGRGRPGWHRATANLVAWCLTDELTVQWAYDTPGRVCNCNRPLVYLWARETLVNEALIATGDVRCLHTHPDTRHYDRCRAAEEAARRERRGIWAHGVPDIRSG